MNMLLFSVLKLIHIRLILQLILKLLQIQASSNKGTYGVDSVLFWASGTSTRTFELAKVISSMYKEVHV